MKKLLILAVLVMASGMVFAQDDSVGYNAGLTGSIDLAYQSQYIWRGFDVFNDDAAAQLTANLDFFGTGFGMNVVGHHAIGSGHENDERWDYNLYYGNVLLPEDVFQTNYRIGFVYYNYAELPHHQRDFQEMHAILSMPNVTGVKGLVPSYALVKMYPANGESTLQNGGDASGFMHIGMLDYTFAVPGVTPDVPEQVFKLHSELVYNDGVSPYNTSVDNDWSHAVFGISTDVDLGYGFSITPGVYYQYSMEKTVNTEDETWVTVGGRYSF